MENLEEELPLQENHENRLEINAGAENRSNHVSKQSLEAEGNNLREDGEHNKDNSNHTESTNNTLTDASTEQIKEYQEQIVSLKNISEKVIETQNMENSQVERIYEPTKNTEKVDSENVCSVEKTEAIVKETFEFEKLDQSFDKANGNQESPSKISKSNDIPNMTPSSRKSMIPCKHHASKEVFETPCNKMNSSHFNAKNTTIRKENSSISNQMKSIQTPSCHNVNGQRQYELFMERAQMTEIRRKKIKDEMEQQEVYPTTKKLSKKEIQAITDRLAPKISAHHRSENDDQKFELNQKIPQTPSSKNSKVFNRLYEMSTCKKADPNEAEEELSKTQTLIGTRSNFLAIKKDIEKINEIFDNKDICTEDEMFDLLISLKILDKTTISDKNMEMLTKIIHTCAIKGDQGKYNAQKMKNKLILAIQGTKHHKFQNFVNAQMAIARANEKNAIAEKNDQDIIQEMDEFHSKSKLSKETLDRLLAPKISTQQSKEISQKQESLISKRSEEILKHSQRANYLMGKTLEERSLIFEQEKGEAVEKMAKIEKEKEEESMKSNVHLGSLPEFYDKLPEEIKTRKDHKEQVKIENVRKSSYEEFKKMKSKLLAPKPKPTGWEKTVQRMRLGRIERNEIQEALDFRAVKPVQAPKHHHNNSKHINPPTNESDQIETPELDSTLGI